MKKLKLCIPGITCSTVFFPPDADPEAVLETAVGHLEREGYILDASELEALRTKIRKELEE